MHSPVEDFGFRPSHSQACFSRTGFVYSETKIISCDFSLEVRERRHSLAWKGSADHPPPLLPAYLPRGMNWELHQTPAFPHCCRELLVLPGHLRPMTVPTLKGGEETAFVQRVLWATTLDGTCFWVLPTSSYRKL